MYLMPRRVQDIVPGDRRSIRDVSVEHATPTKHTRSAKASNHDPITTEAFVPPKSTTKGGREIPIHRVPTDAMVIEKKLSTHRVLWWFFVCCSVIGLVALIAWVASTYFSRATFTITPKIYPITVNGTYIAKGIPSTSLSYEVVNFSDAATTTVPSTEGSAISIKAQGTITIYNDNSQAQKLVAGSRLSNKDNNIYKLTSSVTVPARTQDGLGTVTTKVIADLAGETSNMTHSSNSDLMFVGFKGTAKYKTIYARTTSDIMGGFEGTKKVVSATVLASTSATLKSELTSRLLAKARAVVPDGYVMYDDVYTTSFSSPTVSGTDPKQATVSVEGTVTSILFDKKRLIEQIAGKDEVSSFGEFAYTAVGLEDLDMTIANTKDFSPQKKNSLILRIKGALRLVGTVPREEIRGKLAGVSLSETQDILKPYGPVIETGSEELVPPWAKVPDDIERISIIIKE
jgi:hypothetical protein